MQRRAADTWTNRAGLALIGAGLAAVALEAVLVVDDSLATALVLGGFAAHFAGWALLGLVVVWRGWRVVRQRIDELPYGTRTIQAMQLVGLLVVAALIGRAAIISDDLTRSSLGRSVADDPRGCVHDGGNRWTCQKFDDQSSGTVTYRVTVDDNCWEARRDGPSGEGGTPPEMSGCTGVLDQDLVPFL